MTIDEAIKHCEEVIVENLEKTKDRNASDPIAINCFECADEHRQLAEWLKDYKRLLEQQPCEDCISRQAVLDAFHYWFAAGFEEDRWWNSTHVLAAIRGLPSVAIPSAEPQIGHCKECKYFEYDSVAKVDGIPLIVAHEICNKWGDGCKTKEDGYCFLFEPNMSEIPTGSKPEISSYYGLKSYVRKRSDNDEN